MEVKYDSEADAIYVYLDNKPYVFGKELDDERRIDYATDNTPIGIELLDVSYGVNLTDLPYSQELVSLLSRIGIKCYYGLTNKRYGTWTEATGVGILKVNKETYNEPFEAYDAVVYLSRESLSWMVGKEEVTA